MRHVYLALVLLVWPIFASAQTYPDYMSLSVNDFANILDERDQTQITAQLDQLREETGVELVLVTLPRLNDYADGASMEKYATNLFNTWSIGDKTRNDGIMVLVLPNDRRMRLELGAGYPKAWDAVAQDVIDYGFLPDFREDDYPKGIKTGITTTIEKIALPFAANAEPPKSEGKDGSWLLVLLVPLLAYPFRRALTDKLARFKTCPSCGKRGGLRASSTTKRQATTSTTGLGERHVYCTYCDHSERSDYTISKRSKSSSNSFGGGRSSGGGASGKW
ncbi:MAG: TPM domain-containing protein [Sulfitobacter sp.]